MWIVIFFSVYKYEYAMVNVQTRCYGRTRSAFTKKKTLYHRNDCRLGASRQTFGFWVMQAAMRPRLVVHERCNSLRLRSYRSTEHVFSYPVTLNRHHRQNRVERSVSVTRVFVKAAETSATARVMEVLTLEELRDTQYPAIRYYFYSR